MRDTSEIVDIAKGNSKICPRQNPLKLNNSNNLNMLQENQFLKQACFYLGSEHGFED